MKRALAISNVLSWLNLIIAGLIGLGLLVSAPASPFLIIVVLLGCIVLHSYASLQLRKSILKANVPLGNQTPVGIRLMGYMAMFFAIMQFMSAVFALQNKAELLKQMQLPSEISKSQATQIFITAFVISLLFSLSVIINVIINFRLLRWYVISQNSSNNQ